MPLETLSLEIPNQSNPSFSNHLLINVKFDAFTSNEQASEREVHRAID
jgi:hypothetical protein